MRLAIKPAVLSLAAIMTALVLMTGAATLAAEPMPGPRDKCPVCGMFVSGYTEWIASVALKSGTVRYFDGPKDMFRFIMEPGRYEKGITGADIQRASVREYYGLKEIDARSAFYVIDSDVYGPMGHELVPFATKKEAEEFMRDHKGRSIIQYDGVTPEILKALK